MNYTEENQKAEFLGGAIGAGCCIIFVIVPVVFLIICWIVGSLS